MRTEILREMTTTWARTCKTMEQRVEEDRATSTTQDRERAMTTLILEASNTMTKGESITNLLQGWRL